MQKKQSFSWHADRTNVGVWQCTENPEHRVEQVVSPGCCELCDGDMVPAPARGVVSNTTGGA